MKYRKFFIVVALLSVTLGIPLVKSLSKKRGGYEVVTTVLTERDIHTSILASGKVSYHEEASLSTEIVGKVVAVNVVEGEFVEKGQVLVKLESENYSAAVTQNEVEVRLGEINIDRHRANVEHLEKKWRQQESLYKQELISTNDYDDIAYQLSLSRIELESSVRRLDLAKAGLARARDRLDKTSIMSPLTGVVTDLNVKVGEVVIASSINLPGSNLISVANPKSKYAEILVDEADIADVAVGQQAEVVVIAHQNRPVKGKIIYVSNSAKSASGRHGLYFTIKVDFTNTYGLSLRPGTSCRAEIFTSSSKKATSLPVNSIIFEEDPINKTDNYFVMVNEGGKAIKTRVKLGLSDDTYQEIISNIAVGMEVVTGPDRVLRHLKDGSYISVVDKI